jgi:hypothetical protein
MKRIYNVIAPSSVSEMAIVDTFTKLIFGEDACYNEQELDIIQTLRRVDHNVTLDDHREMGGYLRAMGVKEMIGLVAEVRLGLAEGAQQIMTGAARDSSLIPKIQ